ncbi:Fungal fruit body lectin [Mycena venus]|uniref:Fungal fruit body lectin n=1 Tax=Mycena venus TaxID=2733690 RepID=A0A8H7CSM5_9AGAR|nr:Fungal fruit body lectin [Mycena venus]
MSYPYTITVHIFQSKPDSGVYFHVVEQMTRYANTNEWNFVPGGLAFKSGYSGTSGSLRFADKGGEQFVVSLGVHNCKRWCDIVTDLSTAQTAATVNAEYNTNTRLISQREKQLTHCSASSNKGRTIQVNYSVAEGTNLVANVIIG